MGRRFGLYDLFYLTLAVLLFLFVQWSDNIGWSWLLGCAFEGRCQ